jgi:L-alanine-DL-glutamate epimerase-like enolase superfamily enzyme
MSRNIAEVKATVLSARPERGVVFAIGRYDVFRLVLVEVRTDDGLVGFGEAIARRGARMTEHAVKDLLAPVLVGRDPTNIEGLWHDMYDRLRRWGHSAGVVIEAMSGVDCALWDIAGKAAGKPVRDLLHGAGRTRVPAYGSSVYIDSFDAMVADARAQVSARGYAALKIKIGRSPEQGGIRADVESVAEIRGALGPGVDLMVDANGAYNGATGTWVGRELEAFDVKWLEEPVPPDDLNGYRRVRSMTSTPLAAGESHFATASFRPMISEGLIDYVQPDLGRCGGITSARHIASLASAFGVGFAPHTGFSGGLSQLAALQLAAAAPEIDSVEHMFIDNPAREIFVEPYPDAEGGFVDVPCAPGLGLDLDFDRIATFSGAVDDDHEPDLARRSTVSGGT